MFWPEIKSNHTFGKERHIKVFPGFGDKKQKFLKTGHLVSEY